tara:strand:+ start:266 stop:1288 length:1023 start_codon:yes stop_codon:yes gene_type:complete
MYINELNLKNIKIKKQLEEEIPSKINLSKNDIEDFNNRKFKPTNINKMIELILFLEIENYNNFILENATASKISYQILDIYKDEIMFPMFMTTKSLNSDNIPHKVLKEVSLYAVEYNLVKWLKYGYKFDHGWSFYMYCVPKRNKLFNVAIKKDHLESLKVINYYYSKDHQGKTIPFQFDSMRYALNNKNNQIAKYLYLNKCKIDDFQMISTVIEYDNLDCFQYFYDKFKISESNLKDIIRLNRFDFFEYLDKINFDFPWNILHIVVRYDNLKILKYIISRNWFIEKDSAANILYTKGFDYKTEYIEPLKKDLLNLAESYNKNRMVEFLECSFADKKDILN